MGKINNYFLDKVVLHNRKTDIDEIKMLKPKKNFIYFTYVTETSQYIKENKSKEIKLVVVIENLKSLKRNLKFGYYKSLYYYFK